MNTGNLEMLVRETLHDSRARSKDTGCFVVNEAGIELAATGIESLGVIENALANTVIPVFNDDYRRRFPGIDYVIGAYLVVGSKYDPLRMVTFLRNQESRVVMLAIKRVPTFFRTREDGTFNFGVAPAGELIEFVNEMAESIDSNIREAARRVKSKIVGVRPEKSVERP